MALPQDESAPHHGNGGSRKDMVAFQIDTCDWLANQALARTTRHCLHHASRKVWPVWHALEACLAVLQQEEPDVPVHHMLPPTVLNRIRLAQLQRLVYLRSMPHSSTNRHIPRSTTRAHRSASQLAATLLQQSQQWRRTISARLCRRHRKSVSRCRKCYAREWCHMPPLHLAIPLFLGATDAALKHRTAVSGSNTPGMQPLWFDLLLQFKIQAVLESVFCDRQDAGRACRRILPNLQDAQLLEPLPPQASDPQPEDVDPRTPPKFVLIDTSYTLVDYPQICAQLRGSDPQVLSQHLSQCCDFIAELRDHMTASEKLMQTYRFKHLSRQLDRFTRSVRETIPPPRLAVTDC